MYGIIQIQTNLECLATNQKVGGSNPSGRAKTPEWQEKTVLKNTVFSFAQSVWFSTGFERTKKT